VDEPVIPIIPQAETRLGGYYRILSVDVPTTPVTLLPTGILEYVIHARRIGAFRSAYIESMLTGAMMANGYGAISTLPEPFHAYTSAYEYTNSAPGWAQENRDTSDGSTNLGWIRMNPGGAPVYKAVARWAQAPSAFYDAACVLTNGIPVAHTVVGQKDAPRPDNWTISNGLVSVSWNGSTFQFYWADASHTIRTSAQMFIQGAVLGTLNPVPGLTAGSKIIRNSPEEVILRLPMQTAKVDPCYVDVSVRRGSRIVRFYVTTAYAAGDTWTFGNAFAGVASTAIVVNAINAGSVWTANDAYSNRVLICSAAANTQALATGRFTSAAGLKTFECGVSMELGGTGSTLRNTALSQVYQYLVAQAERMQVVGL
jgi:hypothetical protein